MTRGCATLGKVSIVPWYRSADVEISCNASYKMSPKTVGKLLEKQDGGALREGIRGLSEALLEMEV
jgi:hypothetical protein